MGKKQRQAAQAAALEAPASPRQLSPVGIALSTDGASFLLTFHGGKGHTVRVPVPGAAESLAIQARKRLTTIRDKMMEGQGLPTTGDIHEVLEMVRVAEKALQGLGLMRSTLAARASAKEEPKINSAASPTQALVDAFLKSGGKIENEEERAKRTLEDKYGLNVDDFLEGMDLAI